MKYQLWKNTSKKRKFVITGVIIVLCLGIMAGIQMKRNHSIGSTSSTSNKQQTTVDVASIQRTNLTKRISLTGQTVPEAQVDIAAKYQGKVVAVYAKLGQEVSQGQELVAQDTGDADIAIQQNQAAYQQASADAVTSEVAFNANYDRAKADYQKALVSYQRNKTLYDIGGISKDSLDSSEQQLADAKASLDTLANQMNSGVAAAIQSSRAAATKAQHSVSATEKQRDDLVLRAPRSGVIGYRQVEVGDMVSAGQKLLSIYDNSHIYIDCQVSEQDLAALSLGMNVDVQLDSLGKTVPGQIIYISPASDPQTMTFSLRIVLSNPGSEVRSGMFARTVINTPLRQNTLVVPKDAVLEKNGESFVFVVNSQNVIEQRTVQVGARGDQNVEILSGINDGEQIAVTNLSRLRSGITIIPNVVTLDDRGDGK